MESSFELGEVRFIKRIVVGNAEPGTTVTEDQIQQQMDLVNRCLTGTPRGHLVNIEKNFSLYEAGGHQVVVQYAVYHIAFARKPSYLDDDASPAPAPTSIGIASAAVTPAVQAAAQPLPAVQPPSGAHDAATGDGITLDQLRQVLMSPDGDPQAARWLAPLNAAMRAWSIDTPARRAAFLAQVLAESAELHHIEESLSYDAKRLHQVWPSRFPSVAAAEPYSHKPQALGNLVYANRMGNGDEASGDGWRYRGRGLITLTGRDNYAHFARAAGLDVLAQPDLLLAPEGAASVAAWFWSSKGLNELADHTTGVDGDQHFEMITDRVNGGSTGWEKRHAYWMRARRALGQA